MRDNAELFLIQVNHFFNPPSPRDKAHSTFILFEYRLNERVLDFKDPKEGLFESTSARLHN